MSTVESVPPADAAIEQVEVKEEKPCDIATLQTFNFDRILSEGESVVWRPLPWTSNVQAEKTSTKHSSTT